MKRRIALFLIMFFFVCSSVEAKEINGNEQISATGQTSVTAQIELPGDSDGTQEVSTGDNSRTPTYISLMILSTMIILVSQLRVLRDE